MKPYLATTRKRKKLRKNKKGGRNKFILYQKI